MNWFFGKKEKKNYKPKPIITKKDSLLNLENSGMYGAVTIGNCNCSASLHIMGKYFSFKDAPLLPLEGCTENKCSCVYQGISEQRHKDIRVSDRREALRMEDDRRQKVGRRKNDSLWKI